MNYRWSTSALGLFLFLGGCTLGASKSPSLVGERVAHMDAARSEADFGDVHAVTPIEHTFELTNRTAEPAVIVSHRTRIDTTWRFADSGSAVLPRTVEPGETVPVAVTAKVRQSNVPRYYVEFTLASGEVVDLSILSADQHSAQ